MRIIRKILRNLHRYVLWALISAVLWAWVFSFVTDTTRAKKVTLFVNTPGSDCAALEDALNGQKPEGIRMIKVHPFEYAAFLTAEVDNADMFIIAESDVGKNLERLCPIPRDFVSASGADAYESGGAVYAVKVYDVSTAEGCAKAFLDYVPAPGSGLQPESYYLCFSASGLHLGEWNGSNDGAAIAVAEALLAVG